MFWPLQNFSDNAYSLDLPDRWSIHSVFYVSCLIPARMVTILSRRQEPLPPMMMETDKDREIKQILKEKWTRYGVWHYLVK